MINKKNITAAFCACMVLSGCETNQQLGAGVGAGAGAMTGALLAGAMGGGVFAQTMSAIGLGAAGAALGSHIGKQLDKRAKDMAVMSAVSHKAQMWSDDDGGEWVAVPSKKKHSNGNAVKVKITKPNGQTVVVSVPSDGETSKVTVISK